MSGRARFRAVGIAGALALVGGAVQTRAAPPELVEGDGHNFEVVAPPIGATVPYLPDGADQKTVGGKTYYVYETTYYRPFASEGDTIYMVVDDPAKPDPPESVSGVNQGHRAPALSARKTRSAASHHRG